LGEFAGSAGVESEFVDDFDLLFLHIQLSGVRGRLKTCRSA
jgi:hypothetical protein